MRKHISRPESRLRAKLVAALAQQGVVVRCGGYVRYGTLVAKAYWRYDRGNVIVSSVYKGTWWLNGRASSPSVNKQEPVFVRVNIAALIGR